MIKRLSFLFAIILFLSNNAVAQNKTSELSKLHKIVDSDYNYWGNKPRIGISAGHTRSGGSNVTGNYVKAVLNSGGVPVIIPVTTDISVLRETVKGIDGLLLIGGEDFHPSYYNEESLPDVNEIDSIRDIYDLSLIKIATDRNVPVLGICRGEQGLNVAFGGTLYQDIPTQYKNNTVDHRQTEAFDIGTHLVSINRDSELAKTLGVTEIKTNTNHHQAVKKVAPGFRAVAHTADGIVEAIEAYPDRNIMGIQWHPEAHAAGGDTVMLKVFAHLIDKATTFKKAKTLHKRIFTVDTHCDTPLEIVRNGVDIGKREINQVNIPKMQEGMLDAIFFAAYTAQGPRDKASSEQTVKKIDAMIDAIYKQVELNKDVCGIAYTADDLTQLKKEGKKAIFIGIENGYGIGKDISNIAYFKKKGVNYITLCHTKDNDICDTSSDTRNEWNGLSPYGKQVIKEMNRFGMLIDVSHAGEKAFWDVIELSTQPIIASHSSVKALCDHDRNLTDAQMRAIAKNGGVVQICLVDLFINPDKSKASITDAIKHIDYAVRVAGIDHVGIASDFDGGGGLIGCTGANDMINITIKLLENGYSEEDIEKIWGKNFLRVLSQAQTSAN